VIGIAQTAVITTLHREKSASSALKLIRSVEEELTRLSVKVIGYALNVNFTTLRPKTPVNNAKPHLL
jgi:hypothetical protein